MQFPFPIHFSSAFTITRTSVARCALRLGSLRNRCRPPRAARWVWASTACAWWDVAEDEDVWACCRHCRRGRDEAAMHRCRSKERRHRRLPRLVGESGRQRSGRRYHRLSRCRHINGVDGAIRTRLNWSSSSVGVGHDWASWCGDRWSDIWSGGS